MNNKILGVAAIIILGLFTFTAYTQQGTWKAPASADQKKNTVAVNEQSLAAGKKLYNKECSSCHGKKGKGDGPASVNLGKAVIDMTNDKFQSQSDGSIFWKTSEGKQPMPTFGKKLTEEQIWQLINYIRTFKSK